MTRAAALLALAVLAAACGTSGDPGRLGGDEVRVVGSDSMLMLNRRLAAEFMALSPGTPVVVEGGGTGTGITELVAGRADLAAASRPLSAEEVKALYERFGTLGVTSRVAADALSIYLHPANPVRDLDMAEIAGIFGGEIVDWGAVGGSPGPIRVVIRPPSSGTHRFLRDHVLRGRPYRADAEVVARTTDVVRIVAADPRAIGYGASAYGPELAHCAVDGVAPPTASSGDLARYPLSRHLTLVATAPPEGAVRAFVDFCLAPQGQSVVREAGYVPLWESAPTSDRR